MALAFEQYGEQEGSVTSKKRVELDLEAMAQAYIDMGELNLEEVGAAESTLLDGMNFYNEW